MTSGLAPGTSSTRAPRRLVLVRHGVTAHNAAGIWQGHLDTELTPEGLEQARALAPALRPYAATEIVSSDLRRAHDTARVVAQTLGVPLTVDPRLREIHVGAWQGLDRVGVEAAFPGAQARLAAGEDLRRGGDGETVADVVRRARPAVDDLVGRMPAGGTAIVVTHGVAARALAADLVGMDQHTAWLCLGGLGNCGWAELTQSAGSWRLSLWHGRPGALVTPPAAPHGY